MNRYRAHQVKRRSTYATPAAAERIPSFGKLALVVWAENDKLFREEHGWLLAAVLPRGRPR